MVVEGVLGRSEITEKHLVQKIVLKTLQGEVGRLLPDLTSVLISEKKEGHEKCLNT